MGDGGYIAPDELLEFGASVPAFDEALEADVVRKGWFREKPSKAEGRWAVRGFIAIVLGVAAFVGRPNLPSNGLTLIAVALVIGGVALLVMSRWMQAVTLPGAMIRAMLAAYRRTLEKTMAQARSMDQVVARAGLAWLETPDQAVVWGVALGLDKEIEDVLERSLDDVKDGRAAPGSVYAPAWYGSGRLRRVGRVRGRRWALLELGRSELRRHDGRPRDDRELALVIGWWRRLRRRRLGWRRRRLRRRLLGRPGAVQLAQCRDESLDVGPVVVERGRDAQEPPDGFRRFRCRHRPTDDRHLDREPVE